MSAQESILQAVRDVLVAVTGASTSKVIVSGDKGPRPALPYLTVRVTSANAGDFGPAERVNGLIVGYSLSIDTATDGEVYGVSLTSPSALAITYTAGVGSTAATIAAGLAAAWNADTTTAAACSADGTTTPGTVVFTNISTRTAYALAEGANAAKMTLSAASSTPSARMRERREATVSVQGFGTGAAAWLDAMALGIDSPASLTAQAAAAITLLAFSGPSDLSQLVDTYEEARVLLELRVRHLIASSAVAQVAVASTALTGDGSSTPNTLTIDTSYP